MNGLFPQYIHIASRREGEGKKRFLSFLTLFQFPFILFFLDSFGFDFLPVKSRGTTGLAAALLLWPTISEQLHITRNIHHNLQTQCPTAKTGLLGGGAFLSLDSALFWLVCLMLANNARDDYFEETTDLKGGPAVDYEADDVIKSA